MCKGSALLCPMNGESGELTQAWTLGRFKCTIRKGINSCKGEVSSVTAG